MVGCVIVVMGAGQYGIGVIIVVKETAVSLCGRVAGLVEGVVGCGCGVVGCVCVVVGGVMAERCVVVVAVVGTV